ncbi:uncharacterized protein LOC106759239 isoform X2 [Vigna radiata var. radiata]|uniref:Uncharacterized protein LOC106759239 isoform X2 n=1 Tax=Vigna radiata var. radiata TaxID=3916 RepID=A0A3Q0EWQ8_VIGRR|nr:uncharacterized protein LOC106759239 isoform X2 [Vigna radiata var. radiata]
MKINGRDISESREIDIAEQVDYLLKQATGVDNLCNMYEGRLNKHVKIAYNFSRRWRGRKKGRSYRERKAERKQKIERRNLEEKSLSRKGRIKGSFKRFTLCCVVNLAFCHAFLVVV